MLAILIPFVFFGVFGLAFYAIIEYLHYSVGILLAFISLAVSLGLTSGVINANRIEKEENPVPEVSLIANISGSFT